MAQKKNVKTGGKGGAGSPQVGAPTTYRYGKGQKQNNMTPVKGHDK